MIQSISTVVIGKKSLPKVQQLWHSLKSRFVILQRLTFPNLFHTIIPKAKRRIVKACSYLMKSEVAYDIKLYSKFESRAKHIICIFVYNRS